MYEICYEDYAGKGLHGSHGCATGVPPCIEANRLRWFAASPKENRMEIHIIQPASSREPVLVQYSYKCYYLGLVVSSKQGTDGKSR